MRVGRIVVPKALAGLLVVALVAAVVVTTVRRAQALPDLGVPESDELLDGRPDDGLDRYVVRLDPSATGDAAADAGAADGTATDGTAADAAAADAAAADGPALPPPTDTATLQADVDALVAQLEADGLTPRLRDGRAPGGERPEGDTDLVAGAADEPGAGTTDAGRDDEPEDSGRNGAGTTDAATDSPPQPSGADAPEAGAADDLPLADVAGIVEVARVDDERVAVATTLSAASLAALPGVAEVTEEVFGEPYSADPLYGSLWGLHNTGQTIQGTPGVAGADLRWEAARATASGDGVLVAVIDSGVQTTHPDLAGVWWRNADEVCGNGVDDDGNGFVDDCEGWDFVNGDPTVFDTTTAQGGAVDNAHGTHVTGTIAARVDNGVGIAGVAPDVEIMPLKVIENGVFPMSRASAAIQYAVANGADVINASFGTTTSGPQPSDLAAALEAARAAGVLVVAAAGNDAQNIDSAPRWPASSAAPNVVTVGASTNTETVASFSNVGAANVDLFAPGAWIVSTMPGSGYAWMSGTSMAAPKVSGVAALVADARGLSGDDLRDALMATAVPGLAYTGKAVTGARVDAEAAVAGGDAGGVVELRDFHAFEPDVEHTGAVRVRLADSTALEGVGEPAVRATLGMLHEGEVHGVIGHRLSVALDGTTTRVATDADAQLWLTPAAIADGPRRLSVEGVTVGVTTTLPTGRYALLVEVVDRHDPGGEPLVAPAVGAFTVGDPDAAPDPEDPEDGPGPGDGGDPGPGDGPGAGPGPGGGQDPGGEPGPGPGDGGGPGPGDEPGAGPGPGDGDDPDGPGAGPGPGDGDPDPGDGPGPGDGDPDPGDADPDPGGADPDPGEGPGAGPGPTPDDPGPDPGAGPAPETYTVFPASGPTTGGTSVQIVGGLPADPIVRFGGSPGSVVHADASLAIVITPPHSAGPVDVRVSGGGQVIELAGAFTYVDDGADQDPGPEPVDEPEEPAGPPARTARQPFDAPNGLRLDAFLGGHPLRGAAVALWTGGGCTTAVCAAVTL